MLTQESRVHTRPRPEASARPRVHVGRAAGNIRKLAREKKSGADDGMSDDMIWPLAERISVRLQLLTQDDP